MKGEFRVGQGVDFHPFAEGRKLFLGGIEIPHTRGLLGHSDADAVCHAIVDAILGALALGDIGHHFPDSDPKWKGCSSLVFLKHAVKLVIEKGWKLVNVDSTVVTEEPILKTFFGAMRAKLAEVLNLEVDCVSVKATRPERLGAMGRKEGLVVFATALVSR